MFPENLSENTQAFFGLLVSFRPSDKCNSVTMVVFDKVRNEFPHTVGIIDNYRWNRWNFGTEIDQGQVDETMIKFFKFGA